MKRHNHYSITAGKYIRFARITKNVRDWMEETGIQIIRAKVGDSSKIGIHKLECEQDELEDAMEQAQRDNFPAIYLHTFKTWRVNKGPRPKARILTATGNTETWGKPELRLIQGGA